MNKLVKRVASILAGIGLATIVILAYRELHHMLMLIGQLQIMIIDILRSKCI